jgi:hypothetical protein
MLIFFEITSLGQSWYMQNIVSAAETTYNRLKLQKSS